MAATARSASHGRLDWAGYALGFGLGGFFDGILLHQILQWHHLLSAVEAARNDLPLLILSDGLFHLPMYVVTAIGLVLLWRARGDVAEAPDRRLFGAALIGFGAWHVLDAVLSHWLLGIHRIRMDTDNPLLWDVLWLAVFGLAPLAAGMMLRRRRGRATMLMSAPAALALAAVGVAAVSLLPPKASDDVLVVFRPDISPAEAHAAMLAVDGTLLWADAGQRVWAIRLPPGTAGATLYRYGALLVGGASWLPPGCFNLSRGTARLSPPEQA